MLALKEHLSSKTMTRRDQVQEGEQRAWAKDQPQPAADGTYALERERERVLVAGTFRWPVYAPAFCDALQGLGCTVHRFPFERYLMGPGLSQRLCLPGEPLVALMNLALRREVARLRPTILLIWNGLAVWPSTVRALARHTWVAGYTNDDPFGPRGGRRFWQTFRKALPHYCSHHVYRDLNINEYRQRGAGCVEILRAWHIPWVHYPVQATTDEQILSNKSGEVLFVGHGEPYREQVIRRLDAAGIATAVKGPAKSWSRSLQAGLGLSHYRFSGGWVDPERFRRDASEAAICLGFLSRQNRDDYTRRYFEIPACGGFLLAERTPLARRLFNEGVEAEFFSSPEEAVHKCRYYLDHPEERAAIAHRGHQRSLRSGYDVTSRAELWLRQTIAFRAGDRPCADSTKAVDE